MSTNSLDGRRNRRCIGRPRCWIRRWLEHGGWSTATDDTGTSEAYVEPLSGQVNTGASSSRFTGPPLRNPDEIRLLVLDPWTHPLRASFEVTTLQAPTPYLALSYAWGPTHADGSHLDAAIELDGHLVRITSHLRKAFERIQQHSYSGTLRHVWCDAICIDQANVHERNRQVAMMGRVYAGARCVFIWLGDEWDDPWFFDQDEQSMYSIDGGTYNMPTGVAVEIRQSSYFTRRWIIQEIRLQPSRYVLAGVRIFPFKRLERPTRKSGKPMPSYFTNPGSCILDNVIICSDAECTDPRDRIFALLALSSYEPSAKAFAPNYAEHYTDLHTRFAATYLRQSSLLKILACAVETRRDSLPNRMPSWVPDWQVAGLSQTILPLRAFKSLRTFGQGPCDSGRMHLRVRLYWLCSDVAEDCQYGQAMEYIRDWRSQRGLSNRNNAEDYQHITHACAECAGYAFCFVEDEGWGLLLTRASSPSVAQTGKLEEFLLVDWFCAVLTNIRNHQGDLRHDGFESLRCRAWFNATAISELTSIVLV
ncbi:hypothetical protein LTR56_005361 [Elasticomyces elasticus]|nr:hypothetical protein LTR22_018678 [Elasticomyces elasticus]KAK3651855.1 hypothetical protein LTR56_005361 [Elasticomyces elasticus]KAK4927750.1 hypothetical protein LTR49_005373 [Elasticomyces elasticus]KAK5761422.1 hypothetical protein LTS12_008382 [Elasticomyces elasticus]